MRSYLVTFGVGEKFEKGQKRLVKSALKKGGIDESIEWGHNKFIKTDFYAANRKLFSNGYGKKCGWGWKPYIILRRLNKINDGDFVVYHDSGFKACNHHYVFLENIQPLLRWCETYNSGIIPAQYFFKSNCINRMVTKRDCFVLMNCDEPKYWDCYQVSAAWSIWQKNRLSLRIVNQWFEYCKDERINTEMPNACGLPNLEGYRDHWGDQSVMTNLILREGLKCYPLNSFYHKAVEEYHEKSNRLFGKIKSVLYSRRTNTFMLEPWRNINVFIAAARYQFDAERRKTT